ncbi:MAG TPA: hypothetical protein VK687_05460 [Bryobacteraceae bacterium]|nr:hypothetical protein [Bryobacteraceae bacterium]
MPKDGHMPQLHQSRLLAQAQCLHKQPAQTFQMLLPETGDRVVIRMLVRRQVAKRHIVIGGLLDAP